jgi:large subunit ribosomal protein L31e
MAKEQDKSLGGNVLMEKEKETEPQKTEEEQEELPETAEEKAEAEEAPETEATEEKPLKEEAETEEEKPLEAVEEEKEEKPPSREKKEEEEIVEERIYTVPLGKAWIMPPRKRSPRAVRMLRTFMVKHMKMETPKEEEEEEEEPKKLVISNEVNEKIWGRGVEKPPRKIRVRAAKDKDGNVTVYLAEGD